MSTVTDQETKSALQVNLRKFRGNLSFAEVARRCGTCATAIKEIEEGKRMPGAGLLTRIADALGCSVENLLRPVKKSRKTA